MATPYDSAIAALDAEIESLKTARDLLERRRREMLGNGSAPPSENEDEPTNEEAVERIMGAVHPGWIGVPEIVERGPAIGGRDLNKNSVRWVLKHWHDDEKITKRKEGRRVKYRLNK